MAEPKRHGDSELAPSVWVRRCVSCLRHDLSAAFGQLAMVSGPWSCTRCLGRSHELVRVPFPSATPVHGCPYMGAA